MKKLLKDKKIIKTPKKRNRDNKAILDKYGDKSEETIDYGRDKPPHW
tara:strand:- start:338 stop:478 length:141 start_codon:yes stop_codon:yes gene_type:complete